MRSGSGTPEDPFVISGWRVTGQGNYGVDIRHTTASWIVREVLVDATAGAEFRDGFWIVNVTGGMLDHVEARHMPRYGIYVGSSRGNLVCDSAVRENGFVGLYAHNSTGLVWDRNVANANNKHGFYYANYSIGNRITRSESYDHVAHGPLSFGIYSGIGADANVMDNNTLHNNGAGVQVNLVSRNVIRDNVITANVDRGVSITQSTDTIVANNVIQENANRGVLVAQSRRISVLGNDVRGQITGIDFAENGDHTIAHNRVRDNTIGIRFPFGVSNNLVYDNLFSNERNADDDDGGQRWNVSKQPGPNVIGGAFLGGNYWSDVTDEFHDHDEDGLAESHGPYALGIVAGGDYLPLVGANGAPHASFDVSDVRPDSFERVDFVDTSVAGAFPLVNRTWEFHDGTREYGANASRTYESAGDFTVSLRVRDSVGLTSTATVLVTVQNVLPVPRLAGPSRILAPTGAVTLDATGSTDADGRIVTFEWDFGDGAIERGAVVTHRYATEAAHAGSLLVVDDRQGSRALGFTVVADWTPPSTEAVVSGEAGNAGWLVRDARARLAASDALAGVAASEWRVASGAWERADGWRALPEGSTLVEFRSVDAAGNVEATRSLVARVDGTPPATRYEGPAAVGGDSLLALAAADAASGVARTFYRIAGESAARLYAGPFALHGVPEGNVTIEAWSEDVAGNAEAPFAFTVLLDRSAPALEIRSPTARSLTIAGVSANSPPALDSPVLPEAAVVVGSARIRVEAADALSGIARVRVVAGGEVLLDAATGFESVDWIVAESGFGSQEIVVEAWDAVGNRALAKRLVTAVPVASPPPPR